ncbi:hypothetical protein ACLB2K_033287 [Fragaria x ananassa]
MVMNSSVEIAEYIYNHFSERKWSEITSFYEDHSFHVFMPLNHLGDTALHLAAYSQDMKLVESLLKIVYYNTFQTDLQFSSTEDEAGNLLPSNEQVGLKLSLKNKFGNTPLHEAASTGNVELVKLMLEFEKERPLMTNTRNKDDQKPFFMAAIYGKTELIKYWEKNLNNIEEHVKTKHSTIHSSGIIRLKVPHTKGSERFLLADIPNAFKSGYSFGFLEKLIYDGLPVPKDMDASVNNNESQVNPDTQHGFLRVQRLREMKKKHGIVVKITKTLAEEDKSWQGHNTTDGQSDTPVIAAAKNGIKEKDTPLIAATKNGIAEIVEAILDVFPQAIEHENNKRENNRRTNVLDLLKDKKFKYPRLIWKFDKAGDGILHKAAYKTGISSRERPGEALCLQSDIQWFEGVRKMVPAHHINQKNNEGDTPQGFFTKEHKELVKEGQEWLIRTTNSCIIVAVLIATVAFTSIYTVPGGTDKKGKPLLLNTTAFTIFTASDVAALCFAFTSVVVFLSITTSKMNEQDFRISLPLKLVLGLSMLFFSVAALMIGFAATLVITIRHRLHQAAAPIIAIACFPVAFFLLLQLPLYTNITWFTVKDLLRSLIHLIPLKKCQPRP